MILKTKEEKILFLEEQSVADMSVLDLEHIQSIGGWSFLQSVSPLVLKSSRDYMRRAIFAHEEKDFGVVDNTLQKLLGVANIIGAMKLVRAILEVQILISRELRIHEEMEYLVDCYNEVEDLLNSKDLESLLERE